MRALTSLISTSACDLPGVSFIVSGTYYDPLTSRAVEAEVRLSTDGSLSLDLPEGAVAVSRGEYKLSDPLGRMARHFTLADDARLEVKDLETLSAWEKSLGIGGSGMHLVHLLESRWRWVAASVVFLLAAMAVGYVWGLPLAAKTLAMRLPPKVAEVASEQARGAFDLLLDFKPSQLPEERRKLIRAEFARMSSEMDPGSGYAYRLEFFEAGFPNAFALPDGYICMTDELVEKAKNDREIFGVLAHEIVHVREQHGMRSVLQNSAVFLIWTLMTGDISTVAGMGSALPAVLAESGYSRGFEQEADLGAAEYMIQRGWGTGPLCEMLHRIDPEHSHIGKATEMISTHPLTEKRIEVMRAYEGQRQDARK